MSPDRAPLATGGRLIESLAAGDFPALRQCLDPELRFRALLPSGHVDETGSDAAVDRFRRWFGSGDAVEIVDATVGAIGPKVHVRWRLRLTAPDGTVRLVEQHLLAHGGERLDALDLLCSGFVAG